MDDLNLGLHIDVNGGFVHRVCTVIIYLNDGVEGGRTVFPCAGGSVESQRLGEVLLERRCFHSTSAEIVEADEPASRLMELASSARTTLRVRPQRGAAVLFFSLLPVPGDAADEAPRPDPWSWHGGAGVHGVLGKWTLQYFREVPKKYRGGETEVSYVAALRRRVEEAAGMWSGVICLDELD